MDRIQEDMSPPADVGPARPTSGAGAARGDFESIFQRHFAAMVRLAHLLGSDDPENVAQEAFSRLHTRLPQLSEPDRAIGYLRACLVNITRSRHTHLAVVARYQRTADADVASAEALAIADVDRAVVIAALGRLSPRHREALVLRYWLDLSEKQMADAMGTSVGTVKSHVSRGLAALRSALPPMDRGL
ncbi:RNA polymerase sigma factor (sigma-70 family) [Nakamurella sp. UYEF19]|uniref:RNA polymerase sigma factor n=1 Tax=Nakamurella sp. UYEF19 TaxID=1756392 RepID=UPI003392150F